MATAAFIAKAGCRHRQCGKSQGHGQGHRWLSHGSIKGMFTQRTQNCQQAPVVFAAVSCGLATAVKLTACVQVTVGIWPDTQYMGSHRATYDTMWHQMLVTGIW